MNEKQTNAGLQLSTMRDPRVASYLSLIPGLGQIYNLEPRKGVLFFLVGLTNLVSIIVLLWSQQLVSILKSASQQFNMAPNADIANALSEMHFGSPALTVLLLLFVAFTIYTMRDAHDRALLVRRNQIYAPYVMHLSEATSGSYLFHAVLMITLVLFAFFFLLPAPPHPQLLEIQFMNSQIETKHVPKTHNVSDKNAQALRDPNLKRIVKNPTPQEASSANRAPAQKPAVKPAQAEPAPPAAAKPRTAQPRPAEPKPARTQKNDSTPSQVKPAEPKPVAPKPIELKTSASEAKSPPSPDNMPQKPVVKPVALPMHINSPAPANRAPSLTPLKQQTISPAPQLPTAQLPTVQHQTPIDATRMLAGLTPAQAKSNVGAPAPQQIAVKSTGAPLLIASSAGPSNSALPPAAISNIKTGSNGHGPIGPVSRTTKPGGDSNSFTGPAPAAARSDRGHDGAPMISPVVPGTGRNNTDRKTGRDSGGPAESSGNDKLGHQKGVKDVGDAGSPSRSGPIGPAQRESTDRMPDFTKYMAELQRRIKRAWIPPKGSTSKRVIVRFCISQRGELSNLRLSQSSGSTESDQAAVRAVNNAAPFPPLPAGAPESVDIEFTFDYHVFQNSGVIR